jgi:glycosyltransferase involved in cell wall biosynthesis
MSVNGGASNLRVIFMAGPGDAMQTFEYWRRGETNPDLTHVGYSHQAFDACRALGVPMLALTTNKRPGALEHDQIRVEQWPDPFQGRSGLGWHAAHLRFTKQLLQTVRRFRANVVVLGGEPYAFLLEPLRLFGVRVVQALHCMLWPSYQPLRPVRRALNRLERRFYRRGFDAILSASEAINRQVRELSGGQPPPLVDFLPTFRRDLFDDIPLPDPAARPFRVIFIARMEADKGIFDLIEVARRLKADGRRDIVFDVCGDGAARAPAQAAIEQHGLQDTVLMHGWCTAPRLHELLSGAHVGIVPTKKEEGFNHVVAESLLAGRPVITSPVCPAVEYLAGGVVVVPPEDCDAYRRAILDLADDRQHYAAEQARCRQTGARCLDERYSYGAALRHILTAFAQGRRPEPKTIPLERPLPAV